ncbi:FAD-dependent oxidoreductase [Lapidilactobacillus bayanensis]|uniref:FAD-dependent oxidoreductase n=1 Tax=Lapidilactobacillus bayanensis TaxID=2485998 RepID=UPI000F77F70B|nr:FAD-dependent oxidoreductase [Lapidilactobacillus bayanensis]
MIERKYDVVIIGGGISGAIAGIAAARSGAKTLIIEEMGFLGGALTGSGVNPMMTFHAGDVQVIRGITDELVQNLVKINKSPGHIKDPGNFTATYTPIDSEGMKYELEKMYRDAGGTVLFHSQLVKSIVDDNKITEIQVLTRNGVININSSVFIDASGDAVLSVMSGVPTQQGRESDGKTQDMTMTFKMVDVDEPMLRKYVVEHPDEFWVDNDKFNVAKRVSVAGFKREWAQAKQDGEISKSNGRDYLLMFGTANEGEFVFNSTRISDHDPTDPWSLSDAEYIGRCQCHELELFVRRHIPGFANAHIVMTGPNIGVRSSRQIEGAYQITAADLLQQRIPDDTIAISGYPIDIHDETASNVTKLPYGGYYGIPYRALVTKQLSNLIVTGRCISASFEAQSAIRTTPTVGAIGEAVGDAAAVAAKNNIDVKDINIKQLRKKLIDDGGFIR